MSNPVDEFNAYRSKMNGKLLADNNKIIKRIFNLDTNAYSEGILDVKTKEFLGLVASAVLRCDDCVKYHFEASHEATCQHTPMLPLAPSVLHPTLPVALAATTLHVGSAPWSTR